MEVTAICCWCPAAAPRSCTAGSKDNNTATQVTMSPGLLWAHNSIPDFQFLIQLHKTVYNSTTFLHRPKQKISKRWNSSFKRQGSSAEWVTHPQCKRRETVPSSVSQPYGTVTPSAHLAHGAGSPHCKPGDTREQTAAKSRTEHSTVIETAPLWHLCPSSSLLCL